MCGICGIFNLDASPVSMDLIKKMNRTMTHRGPDGEGFFIDSNIGLGHRRLSIIDLHTGDQPMGNEDGMVQVVFNGEIYNFLELRRVLEGKGHVFRTRSDTESIVHGYEEWGDQVFEKLRGMFAIALWDGRGKRLLLARDRIGKKPLYYLADRSRLFFASELKALLESPCFSREIDLCALDCCLSFGYVPSPFSIFKGIRKLPPGSYAVQDENGFKIKRYWTLDMQGGAGEITETAAARDLAQLIDEAVRIRLISDVPLGAFLSGGVDSSLVVASMAKINKGEPVKTASIGFSVAPFNELEYAKIVAERYKTDHTEFVVEANALDILDKIVWHLDEPFADSSAIPTYYVSKMARQKVTVALSGDGGDETFAGYINRYSMTRLEDRLRRRIPGPVRNGILKPVSENYPKLDSWPRPFRLRNFLSSLSRSFEAAYFRSMSFSFLPAMKAALYRPELRSELNGFNAFDILRPHFDQNRNPDAVSRAQYVDIMTYLPEDILVKVDRMSMAHSLEVRAPLLDYKIMEYAARLPSQFKLKGGISKYILKKAMEDRLPQEILYRSKQGFCVPLAEWLRGDLKTLANDTVFSKESRATAYFDLSYVRKIWERHQKGREDYSAPLWGLMMFELWHRKFMG